MLLSLLSATIYSLSKNCLVDKYQRKKYSLLFTLKQNFSIKKLCGHKKEKVKRKRKIKLKFKMDKTKGIQISRK